MPCGADGPYVADGWGPIFQWRTAELLELLSLEPKLWQESCWIAVCPLQRVRFIVCLCQADLQKRGDVATVTNIHDNLLELIAERLKRWLPTQAKYYM